MMRWLLSKGHHSGREDKFGSRPGYKIYCYQPCPEGNLWLGQGGTTAANHTLLTLPSHMVFQVSETYHARTTPHIGKLLKPLEAAIRLEFLPALSG